MAKIWVNFHYITVKSSWYVWHFSTPAKIHLNNLIIFNYFINTIGIVQICLRLMSIWSKEWAYHGYVMKKTSFSDFNDKVGTNAKTELLLITSYALFTRYTYFYKFSYFSNPDIFFNIIFIRRYSNWSYDNKSSRIFKIITAFHFFRQEFYWNPNERLFFVRSRREQFFLWIS